MITQTIEAPTLVTRIRAGDRAAEASMVERYGRGVALVLRSRLGKTDVAEDLYQETFRLALIKIRRGELRQPDRLPAYLGGLARNLARDHVRRGARQPSETEVNELPDLPDPQPSQLGQLMRRERAEVVRALLDELPTPRDREVLVRVYLRGDDNEAICADLGLRREHLHRVLFRARERYRALYLARVEHASGPKG